MSAVTYAANLCCRSQITCKVKYVKRITHLEKFNYAPETAKRSANITEMTVIIRMSY